MLAVFSVTLVWVNEQCVRSKASRIPLTSGATGNARAEEDRDTIGVPSISLGRRRPVPCSALPGMSSKDGGGR